MKKRKLKAWQMSTRMLYAMIGVTAVVFALFYLVGYDMPYVFDPDYNAPLLTDIVLIFIYLMVVGLWECWSSRCIKRRKSGLPRRWSTASPWQG